MSDETTPAGQSRTTSDSGLLGIYLNDHLAGATSGVRLAYRLARSHRGPGAGQPLLRLADEIARDREELLAIMADLDVPVRQYKVKLAAALEWVGRAKLNGRILTRSPLSSVDELEALRLGVEGKRSGWRSLREIAKHDDRVDADRLWQLEDRARQQADTLEQMRVETVAAVFTRRPSK
jgi:hypothetical protein